MKKILLLPILLIIASCSNEEIYDNSYEWGFKTSYTFSCTPKRGKEVCECEADKLLENFSQSELNSGNLDDEKLISIIKECKSN
tara:strand:- start:114 stop:365 length:252 start_codon:yes stop_codon:yes gene_type:complete